MLSKPKIYLFSGISKRVWEPKEILFDKAQKVKKIDIKTKAFIVLLLLIKKDLTYTFC